MKDTEDLASEYETINENRVWYDYGNEFRLKDKAEMSPKLENAVYTIHMDRFGFF